MTEISRRKADHLDLAISGDVAFHQTTTLFECVRLIHDALPELAWDEIETSAEVLGKRLRLPVLIAGMTGGTERAERINRELASLAQERGVAFGLGSQRAMLVDPALKPTFQVRAEAPDVLLLGNIGGVQAVKLTTSELEDVVGAVGADALCVHLNPAMELIQSGGDRDFRGVIATLGRLSAELSVPVIAKETGCGLSMEVLKRLKSVGVRHVDVSGAGGTSWVGVETRRATEARRRLGETFWEWGVPTAVSVAFAHRLGFETIFATGGVRTGLEIAKAVHLGASAGGIARHLLKALDEGGRNEAAAFLDTVEQEYRSALLLSGAASNAQLRDKPSLKTGELASWLSLP